MTEPGLPRVERSPLFLYSEPEAMFRVGPMGARGTHSNGEMVVGSWLYDASGRPSRGSVFVLVDDVFGVAALVHRPAGRWAVTTELSIDFAADVSAADTVMFAAADLVAEDAESGLASGTITGSDGRPLAFGSARVRYSDRLPAQLADPDRMMLPHFERETPGPDGPVERMLGAAITDDELELPPSALLANATGPMHGGILACASEVLAVTAARRTNADFVTTSMRIAFARPANADEPVRLTAETKHGGRTLRVYEVTSRGASGRACTIATVTCQVAH